MAATSYLVPHASYLTESALALAWADSGGADLFTQEGERLRVLFPGRRTGGPGPDYRGAFLETETGARVRGDIELHLASSGWRAHGHQHDRHYNRVILHVVARDDEGNPTRLPNGLRVPVAVLPLIPAGPAAAPHASRQAPVLACSCGLLHPQLHAVLDQQGATRFQARVRRWSRVPAPFRSEALYRALLEGLGYGGDRRPFRRLAHLLPWAFLQTLDGIARRQALLLGTAGLLPEDLRGGYDGRPRLNPGSWRGWSCRPAASPRRRLMGFAVLTARWGPEGPPASILSLLEPLPPPAQAARVLRSWLTVSAPEAGLPGSAPLGRGRADALALNVLLPFIAATADEAWAAAAHGAYPALEEDAIVREMRARLALDGRLTAIQQQGLHRLFRTYCARGRGERCPLRRACPVSSTAFRVSGGSPDS